MMHACPYLRNGGNSRAFLHQNECQYRSDGFRPLHAPAIDHHFQPPFSDRDFVRKGVRDVIERRGGGGGAELELLFSDGNIVRKGRGSDRGIDVRDGGSALMD